jgi:hypothetical protein
VSSFWGRTGEFLRAPDRALQPAFLALAVILGTGYAFLVAPNEVPDEPAHLARAYGISLGSCISGPMTLVPSVLRPENQGFVDQEPISASAKTARVGNDSANIYHCVPYIPPAIALAVARLFHLTAAHAFYLGRLSNLAVFATLSFLALRILPDFQLCFFCLALMPMTLHQAASYSADSMTLGVSFLLIAYCFHLAFGPIEKVDRRSLFVLGFLMLVASLCKFNLWLTLLVLLIPARRFSRPSARWGTLAAYVALCCVAGLSWQWMNKDNLMRFQHARLVGMKVNVPDNVTFLEHEPRTFLIAVERTMAAYPFPYLDMFVGHLGPLRVALPKYLIESFAGMLLVSVLIGSGTIRANLFQRLLLAVIVVASVLSIFSLLWTFEATPALIAAVRAGTGHVAGVQGRYFIPFALLGLAALSWPVVPARSTVGTLLAAGFVLTVAGLNVVALVRVHDYYEELFAPKPMPVLNGKYEGKLIRRPGLTSEDNKVYIVAEGRRYWITDGNWITRHGLREILIIPVAEFRGIPEGEILYGEFGRSAVLALPPATAASRYEGKIVREPGADPDETKVFHVRGGARHWIEKESWFQEHGFVIAKDLIVISPAELQAIPLGSPVE